MSEPKILIRRAAWGADKAALLSVREQVFIQEQGVPAELEWDDEDAQAQHLLALSTNGGPVGTVRLLTTGQIGRMAVLPAWRGRGIGKRLLHAILRIARSENFPVPFLNAQVQVIGFYHQHGFVPLGPEFIEAGIPHHRMALETPLILESSLIAERVLGADAGPLSLDTATEIRGRSAHMAGQARRSLYLFTRDLDATLYDQHEFLEAVKRLALRDPRVKIRVLVGDHEPAVKHGHRLIAIMRHLTSRIEIRHTHSDFRDHPENFLLADEVGYLHQSLARIYRASADYFAPRRVKHLRAFFDQVWTISEVDAELRRLYL